MKYLLSVALLATILVPSAADAQFQFSIVSPQSQINALASGSIYGRFLGHFRGSYSDDDPDIIFAFGPTFSFADGNKTSNYPLGPGNSLSSFAMSYAEINNPTAYGDELMYTSRLLNVGSNFGPTDSLGFLVNERGTAFAAGAALTRGYLRTTVQTEVKLTARFTLGSPAPLVKHDAANLAPNMGKLSNDIYYELPHGSIEVTPDFTTETWNVTIHADEVGNGAGIPPSPRVETHPFGFGDLDIVTYHHMSPPGDPGIGDFKYKIQVIQDRGGRDWGPNETNLGLSHAPNSNHDAGSKTFSFGGDAKLILTSAKN